MQYFQSDNAKIAYREEGDTKSPAIIFIHAFPFDHSMWDNQLREFSKFYRALSFDVRGFGASSGTISDTSIDLYCKDLFALMGHLNISQAILVGLSMGGYIALRAKELLPKKVKALILADTRVEPDNDAAKAKRMKTIEQLQSGGIKDFAEGFLSGALSQHTRQSNPALLCTLKEKILSQSVSGVCAALKALAARTDTSGALKANPVPTLILVGEEDSITPLELAQKMQTLAKHSSLKTLKDAGHLSNLENPQAFNNALKHFLDSELYPSN